jgi:hypothetical protein
MRNLAYFSELLNYFVSEIKNLGRASLGFRRSTVRLRIASKGWRLRWSSTNLSVEVALRHHLRTARQRRMSLGGKRTRICSTMNDGLLGHAEARGLTLGADGGDSGETVVSYAAAVPRSGVFEHEDGEGLRANDRWGTEESERGGQPAPRLTSGSQFGH